MTVHIWIDGTGPWTVSYQDGSSAPPAPRRLDVGAQGWPKPPEQGLGEALSGSQLTDALTALSARRLTDVAPLGRYLFDVLFGACWPAVRHSADQLHLHIAADATLMGLPWEFVRDDAAFLLRDRTLVRRMTATAGQAAGVEVNLSAPPSVLFIVGTRATDPDIRPGAEYLGIFRQGRGLRTRLLLQATEKHIREALASFQPDVVHFICHGEIGVNSTVINILEDDQVTARPLDAARLDAILRRNGDLPRVVVFNACATGAPLALKGMLPLAGELVRRGVALAIGMSGSVDDQASRVFARAWYGALARGHDLVHAASAARSYMEARTRSPDWGLLTLFLRHDVVAVKASPSSAADQWRTALAAWHLPPRRPIHVGRWRQVHAFDQLLGSIELRRATFGRDVCILALRAVTTPTPTPTSSAPRLGCTYLCKELAARAAAQGHLVIHLTAGLVRQLAQELVPAGPASVNLGMIMHRLWETMSETARGFGVAWRSSLCPAGTTEAEAPAALDRALTARRETAATATEWGNCFRSDLCILGAALAEHSFAGSAARIVLIVDDLQSLHPALIPLLRDVLQKAIRVPSFCAVLVLKADKVQDANVVTLDEWLGEVGVGFCLDLQRFIAPADANRPAVDEAWLAHRHNLLSWLDTAEAAEAVALVPKMPQTIEFLSRYLHSPGDFEALVFEVVKSLRDTGHFEVGNDERALKELLP